MHIEEHVKNYQPQILALTGPPRSRPALVDFAYLICKKNSMLVCGNVVEVISLSKYVFFTGVNIELTCWPQQEKQATRVRAETLQKSYKHLRENDIKGFCSLIDNMDLPTGVTAMLEIVGVGKIMPNILLVGYKHDWRVCDSKALNKYFGIIQLVFD